MPTKLNFKKCSYNCYYWFFIGIFWLTLLSQIGILSFVDTFGSFFGPLFGVMIVDYYLIKKSNLSNKDIFSLEENSLLLF